ncbi:MAG: hypothetical protein C0442_10960, partial [Chlorobiaceae bacterium]|nr:hypothetical protein [Chlorobiaceae bacterium]
SDTATQVAAASEQQASAAEQISKNLESISTVTKESSSGINQIANTADELNSMTTNLAQLVGKFKLSDDLSHLAIRSNGKLVNDNNY